MKPIQKAPAPPSRLGKEGRAFWRRMVEVYVFETAALAILEEACVVADRLAASEALIAENGLVISNSRGDTVPNPAVSIARDARGLLLRLVKALGCDLEPVHPGPGRPSGRR
jgi:P27 family predicted phage terminase small subunit